MKVFVVGKFKKPRSFKNTTHLPVIYNMQSYAWMPTELFKDWFFKHFVPAVKENFGDQGLPDDSSAVLFWIIVENICQLQNLFVVTSLQHTCLQM
jgi:hypothetical protein